MENNDRVIISNDVISVIVSLALADEIGADKTGRKGPKSKDITIETIDDRIFIGVDLGISYGTKIPDLARRIQSKVKSSVENMTGLEVAEVNINISSMNIEKSSKDA